MRIGKILPGCLLLLSLSSCSTMQENKDKVIENKIETLLSKMTLEEKMVK
jgi:beta-glucosidase